MKITNLGLVILSACLVGCGGGTAATKPSSTAVTSASSATVASSSVPSSAVASSAAASSVAASSTIVTTNTFTGTNSRLIGRFDRNLKNKARFTWPGSAIEFNFEGTQAAINISSQTQVRFTVSVDGGAPQNLWVESGDRHYSLVSNLVFGKHSLRLTRVSESTAGVTALIGDPEVDGSLALAPDAPKKRLLVIGDSITAGYGVEGTAPTCGYALSTSNQQLAYAAVAANALGADLHAIAWSGIGAWRSYGEKIPSNPTISVRYPRTLADDNTSIWDISQFTPDAILINIGTNDYWEGSATDDYRLAMASLLAKVQSDYPAKAVYLIVSPMLGGAARTAQKDVLSSLVKDKIQVLDLGVSDGSEGYGCDYHPNSVTQARLGKALEKKLKADLVW
jgi:lysophospholipase L1-like esterase